MGTILQISIVIDKMAYSCNCIKLFRCLYITLCLGAGIDSQMTTDYYYLRPTCEGAVQMNMNYISDLRKEIAILKLEKKQESLDAEIKCMQKMSNFEELITKLVSAVRAFPYIVFQTSVTWSEADDFCKKIGQNLVSFRDESQWQEVINSIDTTCTVELGTWTAGRKSGGIWVWNETNVEIDSALWGGREPSGDGDCVALFDLHQHRLNDAPCNHKQCFMCEV